MYSSRKSLLSEALQTASATLGEAERKSQGTLNLPPLCPGLAQSSSGSYLEAHGEAESRRPPSGESTGGGGRQGADLCIPSQMLGPLQGVAVKMRKHVV